MFAYVSKFISKVIVFIKFSCIYIVELQWLEYVWNHEKMFEPGVVRANEC